MLSFSACSIGGLYPTLYNNKVVELIDPVTYAMENSAVNYNSIVPDELTEFSVVETNTLRNDLNLITKTLEEAQKALNYKSENLEQQAMVRKELEIFLRAGKSYRDTYELMLLYFEEKEQSNDPNKIDDLNSALKKAYNVFTEANYNLVMSLNKFTEEKESNTQPPS